MKRPVKKCQGLTFYTAESKEGSKGFEDHQNAKVLVGIGR